MSAMKRRSNSSSGNQSNKSLRTTSDSAKADEPKNTCTLAIPPNAGGAVESQVVSTHTAKRSTKRLQLDQLLADHSRWSTSRPIVTTLFGKDRLNAPRMGRLEQSAEVWKAIESVACVEVQPSTRAILYIHGSPGMGKSFMLRWIASKSKVGVHPDCYKFIDSARILALDFNSSCIAAVSKYVKSDEVRNLLPIARIYYTELAIEEELPWKTFFKAVARKCDAFDCADDIQREFESKILEGLLVDNEGNELDRGQVKVVLLVDDILLANELGDGTAAAYRSQVCRWINSRFCDVVLLSTPDESFIEDERTISQRTVRLACRLPLLDLKLTIPVLRNVFSRLPLTMLNANGSLVSSSSMQFSGVFSRLAGLAGGHPRSIENLADTLQELATQSEFVTLPVIRTLIDQIAGTYVYRIGRHALPISTKV